MNEHKGDESHKNGSSNMSIGYYLDLFLLGFGMYRPSKNISISQVFIF